MAAVPEPGRQNDGGGTSAGGDRCEPREQRDGGGLESKSGSCMPPRSNFKAEHPGARKEGCRQRARIAFAGPAAIVARSIGGRTRTPPQSAVGPPATNLVTCPRARARRPTASARGVAPAARIHSDERQGRHLSLISDGSPPVVAVQVEGISSPTPMQRPSEGVAHLAERDLSGPQLRGVRGVAARSRRLGTGSVMLASTTHRGRGWVREVGPVKAARTRVGEGEFERFDAAPAV
ncbi:hypothetical protein PVAP13_3NG181509 [Panicum virgatum]|uniref:Uncharacterized protein n=1 Tax=Panicum virgatum TaxID=38727 RepID=A0A8T0U3J8_PANVG|nr:hypothetical protein PVAP13_3NG181509 [Panicum virgatum]